MELQSTVLMMQYIKHLRGKKALSELFHRIEEECILKSFHETNITLKQNLTKILQKKKLQTHIPHEHRCEILNQILSN